MDRKKAQTRAGETLSAGGTTPLKPKHGLNGPPAANSGLQVILDSWDRNNRILVNLLRALPAGGLEARAMSGSPSIAEMFTDLHFVRLIFLSEDAPEFTI
jgi:hypothetical protein